MICVHRACNRKAKSGSNYCDDHKPGGFRVVRRAARGKTATGSVGKDGKFLKNKPRAVIKRKK